MGKPRVQGTRCSWRRRAWLAAFCQLRSRQQPGQALGEDGLPSSLLFWHRECAFVFILHDFLQHHH